MRTPIVCSAMLHEACLQCCVLCFVITTLIFSTKLMWCKHYTLSTTVTQEHFIDTYYNYSYCFLIKQDNQ